MLFILPRWSSSESGNHMTGPVTEPYQLLTKYFSAPVSAPSSRATDMAKYILLNAQVSKDLGPGGISKNSPSLMGRIFDVLSRPNYAIAEFAREWAQTGDPNLSAAWEGFTGKKKTTWSDALGEMGMDKGTGRSILGFALDVGTDPTTYIGGAGIAKAFGKGAKEVELASSAEKNLAQRSVDAGQPMFPESFGLPSKTPVELPVAHQVPLVARSTEIPADLLLPGAAKAPVLPGQMAIDFPGFSPNLEKARSLFSGQKVPVEKAVSATVKETPGQIGMRFPEFSMQAERAKAATVGAMATKLEAHGAPDILAKVEAGSIGDALKLAPLPPPKILARHQKAADSILERFNPDLAKARLNKEYPETLNSKQQAKLWNMSKEIAFKRVKAKGRDKVKVSAQITDETIKIYNATEKALVDSGKIPRIGTGENVKLSDVLADFTLRGRPITDDVIAEFGTKIKPGSDLWKSVEILRARGAMSDGVRLKNVVDKIVESKTAFKASGAFSEPQKLELDKFLKEFAKKSLKASSTSPAADRAGQKLINLALIGDKSFAQIAIQQKAKMLDEIVAGGKGRAEVNGAQTRALEKEHGKLPSWSINDNKGMEFFMSRVATYWGQKELRPFSLNAISSSQVTAATREKVITQMFKGTDDITRSEAMRLAQGFGKPSTEASRDLAHNIIRTMENMTSQASGASVLLKAGLSMDKLNEWMRRFGTGFEFKNGKVEDFTGAMHDFSKGTDWLNSWKAAEITGDPKAFIFKFQSAIEQATREKALFDEIGERFGSKLAGGEYKVKITGHPYIDEYHFPADIAKQIPRVVKDWSASEWHSGNKLMQHYDRVLSMWKSGVTIYRPGHHVRNYIGDVYLGWMGGVNSARPYALAAKVQRSMKGAYTDLIDIDRLVAAGAVPRNMATPKPGATLFSNKTGQKFTAEQIAAVAHQKGLLEQTKTLEDIIDLGERGVLGMKPFGGKVQAVARGMSELTNHNVRLAHFIDRVMKSRGSNLSDIFERANREARKWHPTGLDLTPFEKKYMRRMFPFYSWLRKATPLVIEGLVMKPGKSLIPSKAYGTIQEMQGIETPGRDDPFPVDQMFPSWIRQQGVGPVDLPDGLLGSITNQSPSGYVMAGVGTNPLSDILSQIETPGKTIGSSLTPALKIPMELLAEKNVFTGAPISGPDAQPGAMEEYIGSNIPLFSVAQGITGTTITGGETRKSMKGGGAGTERLVNFLTGLGIQGTGPYKKSAYYEATNPAKMELKAKKEKAMAALRDQLGG